MGGGGVDSDGAPLHFYFAQAPALARSPSGPLELHGSSLWYRSASSKAAASREFESRDPRFVHDAGLAEKRRQRG
eukprot:13857800-Alexandrium_andersonii.AAC.1